jgi:hypothetical protein
MSIAKITAVVGAAVVASALAWSRRLLAYERQEQEVVLSEEKRSNLLAVADAACARLPMTASMSDVSASVLGYCVSFLTPREHLTVACRIDKRFRGASKLAGSWCWTVDLADFHSSGRPDLRIAGDSRSHLVETVFDRYNCSPRTAICAGMWYYESKFLVQLDCSRLRCLEFDIVDAVVPSMVTWNWGLDLVNGCESQLARKLCNLHTLRLKSVKLDQRCIDQLANLTSLTELLASEFDFRLGSKVVDDEQAPYLAEVNMAVALVQSIPTLRRLSLSEVYHCKTLTVLEPILVELLASQQLFENRGVIKDMKRLESLGALCKIPTFRRTTLRAQKLCTVMQELPLTHLFIDTREDGVWVTKDEMWRAIHDEVTRVLARPVRQEGQDGKFVPMACERSLRHLAIHMTARDHKQHQAMKHLRWFLAWVGCRLIDLQTVHFDGVTFAEDSHNDLESMQHNTFVGLRTFAQPLVYELHDCWASHLVDVIGVTEVVSLASQAVLDKIAAPTMFGLPVRVVRKDPYKWVVGDIDHNL